MPAPAHVVSQSPPGEETFQCTPVLLHVSSSGGGDGGGVRVAVAVAVAVVATVAVAVAVVAAVAMAMAMVVVTVAELTEGHTEWCIGLRTFLQKTVAPPCEPVAPSS